MEALIQVLESTMAARDPYTVDHQRRVSQIACSIGNEMGLAPDRLRTLGIAGTLHDLGKIAIPAGVLSKPGKLTPLEFALVKTHPQVAYNILKPVNLPGNTADIILQHHERLDGSGYPQGLRGDAILLEARILGVADVMEAMCSHRPYRPSRGLAATLDELTGNMGILYDAAVVQTCLKLYGQDLPALQEAGVDPIAQTMALTLVPVPPAEAPQSPEIYSPRCGLSQAKKAKKQTWGLGTTGQRAWIQLGTASLMGLLMVSSIRGY
jgi:HD-GYP domain-containing protein (c-di-GMP phosphodiesterase class II)